MRNFHLAGVFWLAVIVSTTVCLRGDESHFRYLPEGLQVDPKIPTPKSHLGFRVGERHLQHHQLVSYLKQLAELSPRISLKVYAYTHGGRPCVLLTITSPANHRRLEQIRSAHRKLADPAVSAEVATQQLPAVINMGYGVHGDESSASNSAAVVAYYLAAAQGKRVESILENCVILLDPCLNPDGFNRFASWANGHVGRIQNADPNHVEHNQPFPGGRVNYYWFDLNRDWLPAQHPESQGRLREYHSWKPNVVLDFHEMGTNSTYFFQPGIPTRNNPLTPKRNYDLTRAMSRYHAKALDQIGSLYMTEERFDDFYMGKGSTYPDLHGSIGILFEQASSRGHRQDSPNGTLTFPFTIRNQVATSLSSLSATVDLREKLIQFKRDFYRDSLALARNQKYSSLEFRCDRDVSRLNAFATVLLRHDIQVFQQETSEGPRLIVPAQQPEFRFLLSLTEKRTQFEENIFYDVSTWHLPSAFGVKTEFLKQPVEHQNLKKLELTKLIDSRSGLQELNSASALAIVLDWRESNAPRVLAQLLSKGVKARVARKQFSIKSGDKETMWAPGTVMIPLKVQTTKLETIEQLVSKSAVPAQVVTSGLTPQGIDLGSSQFSNLELPKTMMLIGDGVSRYEAGEVWHAFDTRLGLPLTMVDTSRFSGVRLESYNTIVLVSGSYSTLSEKNIDKLIRWTKAGGNLVLCGSAVSWAKAKGISDIELVTAASSKEEGSDNQQPNETVLQRPFDQARNDAALKLISGAIFDTQLNQTHPLCYGLNRDRLPVFRNNKVIIRPSKNPYANAMVYTADPQIAGYCSQANVALLKNSAAAYSARLESGTVIVIPQNPNFRGFWYGTARVFENAIFFGKQTRN